MSETTPLVSVIVPVHNGARVVAETIASLLAQNHPRLEIVAVDDGSTDESASVLAAFPEVHLVQQANGGVARARNAGVAAATGDFLTFCDQDDLFVPDRVTTQLAFLRDHPEVDYVTTRQEVFLDGLDEFPAWLLPDPIFGDLGGVLPLSGLARREVFETVGPFDPDVVPSDDFDWQVRAQAAGFVITPYPDRPLMRRRIHSNNASHAFEQLRWGTTRTMHKLLRAKRNVAEGNT